MVMTAYDETWRAEQSKTIGGSSAAAVVGKARFKTARDLWDRMHGFIVKGQTPAALRETDDMHRGMVFEPIARQLLAEELGVSIDDHDQTHFLRNDDLSFAHCLIDGRIGSDQIVELKVPRPATIAKVNLRGLIDEWDIQAQHNMAVTNAHICHIGLLDPMSARIHYISVLRDQAFINRLMQEECAFYQSIRKEEPPDQAELEPYEDSTDKTIIDTPAIHVAAETFFRLKEIAVDTKEALELAKKKLIELSEEASVFEVPGLGRFYNKPTKGRRLFQKALAIAEFPALAQERFYKESAPSRPFRTYDLRERN